MNDKNNKEILIKTLNKAIEDKNYIYVIVSIFGNEEMIINKPENVKSKLEYYKNAYNEDLILKTNKNIEITGFGIGSKIYIQSIISTF